MKSKHRSSHAGFPFLTLGAALSVAAAAAGNPAFPLADGRAVEVQANVFTSSAQERAALAASPTGEVVVAWDSRRQEHGSYGVFAQRFNAIGQPVGGEVHINQYLPNMQLAPALAYGPDGHVWFAWTSHGQDGAAGGIVARRFAPDLSSASDEIPVNQIREGDQNAPAVAVNRNNRALVVWTSTMPTADGRGTSRVAARLFDADGRPRTPELKLTLGDMGRDANATVAAHPDGGFIVAFSRIDADGSTSLYAQRLDANGRVVDPPFALHEADGRDHVEPAIDVAPDGTFAAAWHASTEGGFDVLVRRFDAEGQPLGEASLVAAAGDGWTSGASIAFGPDGRFFVAFNRQTQEGGEDVFARFYEADGDPLGEARPLNLRREGDQRLQVASTARRAVWSDLGQIAVALNGAAADDESAAILTLYAPNELEAPAPDDQPRLAQKFAAEDLHIAIPPIWNPDYVPLDPLLDVASDGPDFGFEGIPTTGWVPPDPEMGVGPEHIVLIVNGQIACFTKDGTNLWRDEIEDSFGFWGQQGATGFVFDPEATWDPHAGRFLAMACERGSNGRSYFLLAVSKDDRPETAADWWKYRLDVTSISDNDIDSPNMALDADHIYLTADFFGPDKYLIYAIDKNSVLNGGTPVTNHELIVGASQQSMGIPVTWDADAPAQYIIQSTELSTNTQVIFHAITNPIDDYERETFTLTVPTYQYPNQPPQRGSSSRPFLFEPRFWSCMQRGGSLWAVHHVNSSRVRVRWYEFDMQGWPASGQTPVIKQWGEIDPGGDIHTYFPSVGVDGQGNAAITYARSSPNEYISVWRSVRAAGDPLNTFGEPVLVKESSAPHTSGRWGDYSATVPDPVAPGVLWGHHEFTTGPGGSDWRTWVARFDVAPGGGFALEADPLFAGQNAELRASGATPDRNVYFVYSLAGPGSTDVPALGVTLDLDQPRLLGSDRADDAGGASLTGRVPDGFGGRTLWFQAAQMRQTSNVISETVN